MGPSGAGEETIKVFGTDGRLVVSALVDDPQLSPLDFTIAPNGNIMVSSEWPFGAKDALSSVREYDSASGRLIRILQPDGAALPGCSGKRWYSSVESPASRTSENTSLPCRIHPA